MPDFRVALESREVLLFDGAMGTELYRRGIFLNRCYDELSRSEPELVRSIHREYAAAGARILETNSFGANRERLRGYGLEADVGPINRAAARLAREAAGRERFVAGSIGPLGIRIEPYGPTSEDEARAIFREQAAALAEGGVDLFLLETFSDLAEVRQAVAGCRDAADLPVVALMTIQTDGRTSYGATPEQLAAELGEEEVAALGLNCSVGPAIMLEAIQRMAGTTRKPLAAIPNAGLPREVGGRTMYLAAPDYMATYARKLVQAGVRLIGGCCGTTPEHIREMAGGLRAAEPVPREEVRTSPATPPAEGDGEPPVPLEERSAWGRKLSRGEFLVSVELQPPKDADASGMLAAGRRLAEGGVDAVAVPDGARASMRMSVVAAAALIQREAGIEAVVHYTCRDRNLLGMTGDLLGAQALGLRNLLLVTGDPPRTGPYADATAVFDVDSIGLTNLVAALNRGLDLGGNEIGSATSFVVGVGVNPGAEDLEGELRRWYWKVDAGAEFAVTQPIFDLADLEAFLEEIESAGTRIPVVAGLWPLTGLRNAEFLNHEVPGIRVPAPIMERMRRAREGGEAAERAEGLAIARELLEELRGRVEGVQVSAPGGDVAPALEILEAVGGDGSPGPGAGPEDATGAGPGDATRPGP